MSGSPELDNMFYSGFSLRKYSASLKDNFELFHRVVWATEWRNCIIHHIWGHRFFPIDLSETETTTLWLSPITVMKEKDKILVIENKHHFSERWKTMMPLYSKTPLKGNRLNYCIFFSGILEATVWKRKRENISCHLINSQGSFIEATTIRIVLKQEKYYTMYRNRALLNTSNFSGNKSKNHMKFSFMKQFRFHYQVPEIGKIYISQSHNCYTYDNEDLGFAKKGNIMTFIQSIYWVLIHARGYSHFSS